MNTPTPLVKRNIPAQFGTSAEADFEQNTWTFEMPETFEVYAGEFAIVDKAQYLTAVNYHDRLVGMVEQLRGDLKAARSALYIFGRLQKAQINSKSIQDSEQLLTEIKESK